MHAQKHEPGARAPARTPGPEAVYIDHDTQSRRPCTDHDTVMVAVPDAVYMIRYKGIIDTVSLIPLYAVPESDHE